MTHNRIVEAVVDIAKTLNDGEEIKNTGNRMADALDSIADSYGGSIDNPSGNRIADALEAIAENIEGGGGQPNLQSKTVTPTVSQQTVSPDAGYDALSSVTVNAISPVKAAQTYTPGTTNQTIAAGHWLTGVQTIKGDANLVANNIKSGVSIFGVMGDYTGEGGLEFYDDATSAEGGTMYLVVGKYGDGEVACDFYAILKGDPIYSNLFGSWKEIWGGNGVAYIPAKMTVAGMFTDGSID